MYQITQVEENTSQNCLRCMLKTNLVSFPEYDQRTSAEEISERKHVVKCCPVPFLINDDLSLILIAAAILPHLVH